MINVTLSENLYDNEFAARWITGLNELKSLVMEKTPEWQEEYTGIPADQVRVFVREIAKDAPNVIFHPGWMTARHRQSFYTSRTAQILKRFSAPSRSQAGSLSPREQATQVRRD